MTSASSPTLLWLRRDLRWHDHAALAKALSYADPVQPVFVFDSAILARFSNKQDRRLSFIARQLQALDHQLRAKGGRLLVLYGDPAVILPKLVQHFQAARVVAGEDYEPATIARDRAVAQQVTLELVKDHLIFAPNEVVKQDSTPFKVYRAYAKAWRNRFTAGDVESYRYDDRGRYLARTPQSNGNDDWVELDPAHPEAMLQRIGYRLVEEPNWDVARPQQRLERFTRQQLAQYAKERDQLGKQTTSQLSPYLRFGLVSVREVFATALAHHAEKWLSELMWREFYAMTLFHFPDNVHQPGNPIYRHGIAWRDSPNDLEAWKTGQTGFPIVDAAMRQLRDTGWLPNRARLIAATFLCKDLHLDWRVGEEHFAQYLMDYELASNVGNWQWVASIGMDAQPFFRIFNPITQSGKFDPTGAYIKAHVPELQSVKLQYLHQPGAGNQAAYITPIVDHDIAKHHAIAMMKESRKENLDKI